MATDFIVSLKISRPNAIQPTNTKKPISRTLEVETLANTLSKRHSTDAMTIACLWQLSSTLLTHYCKANHVDAFPLIEMQHDAMLSLMSAKGISEDAVQAALQALQQAGETAHYLHTLPN